MTKLIFDARRKLNSGIGRVSQFIIEFVLKERNDIEIKYLVNEETRMQYQIEIDSSIMCDFIPFSSNELYDLPKLILDQKADVYFSPQFNCSPFHIVNSINIIHDLWYILNPEFVPDLKDIEYRFGNKDNCLKEIAEWLTPDRQLRYLSNHGIELYKKSHTLIHKYLWSQITMLSVFSEKLVFVSPELVSSFKTIFKRTCGIYQIDNGYNQRLLPFTTENKSIFLCLAKLEERKNIDYLIDEYTKYSLNSRIKFKLVIAGDKGYKKYSEMILQKIKDKNEQGLKIEFIENADDSKLINLFSKTRALIVTSKYESYGLPAIEALHAGLDLISTRTGKIKIGLDKYVSFINEPKELNELLLDCDNKERLRDKIPQLELKKIIDNSSIVNKWNTEILSFKE